MASSFSSIGWMTPASSNLPARITANYQEQALTSPRGRPSFDLSGVGTLLGPYQHIPIPGNFRLFAQLREAVPLIDAAIVHIRQLVGTPCVECENPDTKAEIDAWLNNLLVNRVQIGWENWISTWIDDMLLYGRSHAEVVLNNRRDDVAAIIQLHPGTIAYTQTEDTVHLNAVQYGANFGQPVLLDPTLTLTATHDARTDDPNGTSLLWGLPFVAEIYTGMLRALGQTWQRFGSPTFHVNWEPPPEFNDPQGTLSNKIVGGLTRNFEGAMRSRVEGDFKDFFTAGAVKVEVVGAAGETLDFATPGKAILEQIVAKTGLPPLIFGLQWATTERMSTVQASLLGELVDAVQDELEGPLRRFIDLRQRITGGDLEFDLKWEAANLQDRYQEAQADFQEQEATAVKWQNWTDQWRQGMLSAYDMVREFRAEFADMSDDEIKAALPDLKLEPPAAPEPLLPRQVQGAQPKPGANGASGGPPNGARSISYALNGNGRHEP